MAKLTPQQANELANYFLAMAQDIGDYRIKNFDELSKEQNQEIEDLFNLIIKYADYFFTWSATLVMDDIQNSLSAIREVTGKMKITYKTLQDIQKAINIAASVVTLGEAIVKKDPNAIADAIGGLAGVLKA